MLAVIGALTKDHDGWLILLAAVLCFVSCLTTFSLLARCAAAARQPVKMLWLFAASFAFASGVWGTQFVAFLGFSPRAVITFSLIDQDVSLLMATGCALAAFGVYVLGQETRSSAAAAGLLTGMVTAAMHVFGMRTMRNDGVLAWDPAIFAVALLIGGGFATAALLAVRGRRPWIGALCLTAAILGSSLTAMAALGAGSTPSGHGIGADGMMPQAIATAPLAVAITAVSLLILASGLAGAVFDQYLSERSRQEAERLRQFADATFEGLLFWRNGVITDVNPPLCRMLQQSRLSLIGEPLASLVTAASLAMLTDRLERNGEEVFEAELALAGGGTRAVELVVRPFGAAGERTDESAGVVGIRDLSDRKAADLRIQQLAHYDSATGLANRFLFRDRLAQAISMADRTGRGVALFYLDLDRFKAVNDLFGHPAGDRLLQEAANRLSVCVRDTDTVARLGGDEFAIIQVLAGEMNPAATLAQRVLERLGDPYEIDGRVISVGVSIGIALYPHHGSSGETLLRNADLALYRAKASGREMFCFFAEDMDLQVRERQAMEHDLRDAIRRGELELNYQPLFDGQTLELKGHEALVRWRHPVRGNISPAVFIPLAEECGLIVQLGRWVLETACQEASHWDPAHYVAVNLSPRQFRQPDLAQMVMHILRTAGLPPHRLELEVTEGILIDDTERALKLLRFLKTQGVRLALDDFGTGYSSLSYLRRFPFDRIKIDRSFIQGLGGDEDAEAIIRAIVALGHSLRMEVTAEGVETEAQLASLRREHCGQVQGFLLGRPVPAAALHAAVGSDSGSL